VAVEIKLGELKSVIGVLLDKAIAASDNGILSIPDNRDYHWDVPTQEISLPDKQPPQPVAGRFSDDWEFLRPMLQKKEQVIVYTLVHVAPILRYLAEEEVRKSRS
jgi:hypothetical protein